MRYSLHVNIRPNDCSVFARAVCSIIESNTLEKIKKGRLLDSQNRKTFCLHQYYDPAKYFTSVIISMLFSELKLLCSV